MSPLDKFQSEVRQVLRRRNQVRVEGLVEEEEIQLLRRGLGHSDPNEVWELATERFHGLLLRC